MKRDGRGGTEMSVKITREKEEIEGLKSVLIWLLWKES